jgi:mannosyl-3-phosphoglycerate phosphatase
LSKLLFVTDLDGSLLDHDSYSWAAAEPALDVLRQSGCRLVLNSSKTAAEMRLLQQRLDLDDPFICENGAALCRANKEGGIDILKSYGPPRSAVLEVLADLRREGYRFRGFSDMDVTGIAAATGLARPEAALAAQRLYTEPLQWLDDDGQREAFATRLAERGLRAQRGGRFLTVGGDTDKGRPLPDLARFFDMGTAVVIAIGDSLNDLPMFDAADVAVIIRSRQSDEIVPSGAAKVLRSTARGPEGWAEQVLRLLRQPALTQEHTERGGRN